MSGTPHKVLVANRGEIALRIVRTCRTMGYRSVAAHSEADALAPFVLEADEAVCLGPAPAAKSYLDIRRVVDAARESGADAVHPGYGFLSENPDLADAVEAAGLVFVGPRGETTRALGNKVTAKETARAAGVPVNDGSPALANLDEARAAAATVGYPVLLKAAAGGGGRGMRVVEREEDLAGALETARGEARAAFGREDVFLEKLVRPARHIEVQVLGDGAGEVKALGERECSVQRRHQKVLEEAPSPAVDPDLRRRLCDAAEALARSASYRGAGTVEFLLGPDGNFTFLEMNCRLQVEHPVTEAVMGVDLVAAQFHVAFEGALPPLPEPEPRGHAIECRINAEDPANRFAPSVGRILALHAPRGGAVRFDGGYVEGDEVSPWYDSLLGKLICWGATREEAVARAHDALGHLVVLGPRTNIGYLRDILAHPAFRAGDLSTSFLEEHLPEWTPVEVDERTAALAAVAGMLLGGGGRGGAVVERPTPWTTLAGWRSVAAGSDGDEGGAA